MSGRPSGTAARGTAGAADPRGRGQRGQTNIDFVVGITLFLLAITVVLWFMPRIVAPYEDPEKPAVVERAAANLADGLLAADREPGVLDAACTGAFFTGVGGSGCPFDPGKSPEKRLGIAATYRVNATLRWNVSGDSDPEVLCYNGGDVGACGSGRLAVGPRTPREYRSVAAERRVVLIGDQPAVLAVRVW